MLPFWPDLIRPMLEDLEPHGIVEIGSESGRTTRLLLELARARGTRVHAIDPKPAFDVAAWQAEFGDTFVFHRLPSLIGLHAVDAMGAVLIDGDHNWYTVFHELKLVETRCAELGVLPPLILLHDVVWPYGRRDLYYDPDSVPAQFRQPFARKGISPVQSGLLDQGGFNASMCNAAHEGGSRNGVLTAVEDYLAQTHWRFRLVVVPAVFGLAILLPDALAANKPALAQRVAAWDVPEIRKFIERMEMARIAMLTGARG
ncbi:MAG TPA: class I SAM-dependent methyltransferase [Polyangiaceae bacterium]|nr:class I SAM-dependent methyltransferase [Polyangiaceae bacterium]